MNINEIKKQKEKEKKKHKEKKLRKKRKFFQLGNIILSSGDKIRQNFPAKPIVTFELSRCLTHKDTKMMRPFSFIY